MTCVPVNMLPNRITLKDLITGQLVPRQKRTPNALRASDFSDTDTVQTGAFKDTSKQLVRPQTIKHMIPDSGLEGSRTEVAEDASIRSPLGGETRPQKKKRKNENCVVDPPGGLGAVKVDGPHTRGKYARSGPNTRSRSRCTFTQACRRLSLICRMCWNPAKTALDFSGAEREHQINGLGERCSNPRVAGPRRTEPGGARPHASFKRSQKTVKINHLTLNRTDAASIVGKVEDLADQRKVKRVRTATGKVGSPRSTGCEPQVAAADGVQVLRGEKIHPAGFSNIDGHGSLIYSETDMGNGGRGEEKHPHSPADSQKDGHRENFAKQEENGPSEALDDDPEVEEFSCQRARVHLKKLCSSCARTCMPWPFSNRGPKMTPSSETYLAGLGNPSSLGNLKAPVNGNAPKSSASEAIKSKLSNGATDCAIGSVPLVPLNEINVKKEDQRGEKIAAEKCFHSEYRCSLDSADSKLAVALSGYREPRPMSSKIETMGEREGPTASPLLISKADERGNLPATLSSWPLAFDNLNKGGPSPRHEVDAIPNMPCRINEAHTDSSSSTRSKADVLDEISAYEQDILLVDVIQDDPDLFANLPEQSVFTLGPLKSAGPPKIPPGGLKSQAGRALLEAKKSVTPETVQCSKRSVLADSIEEESDGKPWWAQRFTPSPSSSNRRPTTNPVVGQNKLDSNNNNQTGDTSDGTLTLKTNQPGFSSSGTKDGNNGQRLKMEDLGVSRLHQSVTYCRFYFSETLSCTFKSCQFPHSPVEGDEKFCIETILRFSKNPMCLQKASAMFTDYYQKNSPGVFFSNHVVTCLLGALLRAGRLTDVLSVLNVSTIRKFTPAPEFLLELLNAVRQKGLTAVAPELMRLTSQIFPQISALPPSVDGAQTSPDFRGNSLLGKPGMVFPPTTTTTTATTPTASKGFPESLNLACAVMEVELCSKQRNWPQLGSVFIALCQSSLPPRDLEQLSGRIAVALLPEIGNKLPVPFATFADTVCRECAGGLMKTTLGRIGVSLMLRYHKTHQWAKGRRVVEILSGVQLSFSTLKGLLGDEGAASRCALITVAAELFLLSGSIEGALNTLRDNGWFLASRAWPCAPADVEKRTHLLMRLAENTAHRDTLEILSNLPGLKEPHESVEVSQYGTMFNAHLQACVERQMLPVASDLVELMLCKQLAAEVGLLQTLLSKLAKQNFWFRARKIFRRALNAGYYPDVAAPQGLQSLGVPPTLGEVEMALSLEMFISANATLVLNAAASLCITLQRSHTTEGVYLMASNRLLAAAAVLQPKVTLHLTAVNASREQVFTPDAPSVRLWLQHNHLWASEVWSHLS